MRERRLDGIVVFADDSNMHSMEMFDEIQKVNWFGALSVGILAQTGKSNSMLQRGEKNEPEKGNHPVPVQGPACNSSQRLVGWHTFNNLPYAGQSAILVGDDATVLPTNLEWSGFVLNSRLVWKDFKDKPEWVRDLDEIEKNGDQFGNPLVLVKDSSFVEPLGNCGRKVMLWWLRVEARSDSKFPPGLVSLFLLSLPNTLACLGFFNHFLNDTIIFLVLLVNNSHMFITNPTAIMIPIPRNIE